MAYTKDQILHRLNESAANIALLYQNGCINYRGKTADTKEYYTEVIAEWLLEHLDLLNGITAISRSASYRVAGHNGIPENPDSNREEELIAMAMMCQKTLPLVGKILDYQTPLKNTRKDKAGKIDLLAYDGQTLRILELKEPDSKETMLRCVLEGYTYLQTVDKAKLLSDFELPASTPIFACPFVFREGFQWAEMQQERPFLKKLIEMLNTKPYYVINPDGKFCIMEE